jgi:tRNA pseudouridine38-40 synthase
MNYRLTISYDGTRYHGWESKKEVDTIEGKLEAVFARMTEQDVKIHGAGRTDAGVHAMGMVANGFLDTTLTPEEIKACFDYKPMLKHVDEIFARFGL